MDLTVPWPGAHLALFLGNIPKWGIPFMDLMAWVAWDRFFPTWPSLRDLQIR